jgi:hypothetical protein
VTISPRMERALRLLAEIIADEIWRVEISQERRTYKQDPSPLPLRGQDGGGVGQGPPMPLPVRQQTERPS